MGNDSKCQYSPQWIHGMLDVSCEHWEQKEPAVAPSKVSRMEAAQSTNNDNNDITVNTARRTHTKCEASPLTNSLAPEFYILFLTHSVCKM